MKNINTIFLSVWRLQLTVHINNYRAFMKQKTAS